MDFAFTDDQLLFRDALRSLLADRCTPAHVRAAWADPEGPSFDRELWKALADMGILGILAPADSGGLALSMVDLVLLLEETGRAALPGPIVEHAAVAVPALGEAGHKALADAVNGLVVVSAAVGSVAGWATEADLLMLADGEGGDASVTMYANGDLEAGRRQSVDHSRRSATVPRDAGASPTSVRLHGVDVAAMFDRGALGVAAQMLGLADGMLSMTVDYVKERRQFGVPVGSFQAVKHHLANALVKLEHARPAVYRAAWSIAHDHPQRARDVSFAKVWAGTAAGMAARASLQCHGAIGYTFEHDLHLWMKRVWALRAAWGDEAWHRARVAEAVIG